MHNAVAAQTTELLNKYLSCEKGAKYEKLYNSMLYSVNAGGKRIRPYLCALFYTLFSGSDDFTPALPYCAAVEMIHTSSLIHDDLPAMDNDTLRRGMPTNHIKFGEATAILAGDTLLLRACGVAAENKYMSGETNAAAVALICKKAVGMMAGQQIDLSSSMFTAEEADLVQLQALKTGCLLSLACMLGAIAAGKDTKSAENFGSIYGLLFQVTDDILDVTGTDTGKTRGKDERDHKATFVTLFGIDKANIYADNLLKAALQLIDTLPDGKSRELLKKLCTDTRNRKK